MMGTSVETWVGAERSEAHQHNPHRNDTGTQTSIIFTKVFIVLVYSQGFNSVTRPEQSVAVLVTLDNKQQETNHGKCH